MHSPVSCFLRSRKSSIYTRDVISSFNTASIYSDYLFASRIARKLSLLTDPILKILCYYK